jgi:uncharacterized protein YndB with AHSA1/START domain
MSNPAEVTLPNDTTIRVERYFEAPRPLVYRAFTRPELVSRWLLGPPGWTMPICTIDLRPGGEYHYRWHNAAEGQSFGARGTFEAIDAEQRLLTREHFEDMGPPGEARIETRFADNSGGTRVIYLIDAGSREARDAALETGMTDGMEMSFKALDGVLAGGADRGA